MVNSLVSGLRNRESATIRNSRPKAEKVEQREEHASESLSEGAMVEERFALLT